MSAKSIRLILMGCLLLCILACASLPKGNPNSLPVRTIRVTLDKKQNQKLFEQLEKFAYFHSLSYLLHPLVQNQSYFMIEMHDEDFHITAGGSDTEPSIAFYNEGPTPVPQEKVDKLFADLKGFLRKVPDATVADKKSLNIRVYSKHKQAVFEVLFVQLQVFADQHALKFIESSYDPSMRTFLVEMVGDDGFHITIRSVRSTPGEIDVNFFIDVTDADLSPTSQALVDELFKDIDSFVGEYPTVTITERH